jgi:hypothetical protein
MVDEQEFRRLRGSRSHRALTRAIEKAHGVLFVFSSVVFYDARGVVRRKMYTRG